MAEFCPDFAPLPCNATQVALYATWLAKSMKFSSIKNYLSGLNYFIRQNGFPPIDYSDFVLESTLRGIKRELGDSPKQAIPVLPTMLRSIFSYLTHNPGHNAWRAAVLCSFRGLLRKSQITMSDSVLKRKDLKNFQWGLIITVSKTKTIQFQERSLKIPISRCPDKDLCAVHWCERHFSEITVDKDSPAFQVPYGYNGNTPLSYSLYQRLLKHFGGKAGINPEELSSHSMRRGGCTFLAICGASLEEMRTRGDWVSDSIFQYIKTPLSVRIVNDMRVASLISQD